MTLASFNARLRKLNPYIRVRRRTGWVLLKSEGFAMACVFKRYGSSPLSTTICGEIPYHTRPTLWRIERIPGTKKPLPYIHSRMRRGRYEMIRMLEGTRGIRHRWEKQLLYI
jgi:hypothetical protein